MQVGIPENIRFMENDFLNCEICKLANRQRLCHNTKRSRPTRKLEIIASDIMGPFSPAIGGQKYVITFIDLFSKYTIAIPIIDRTQNLKDLQNLLAP